MIFSSLSFILFFLIFILSISFFKKFQSILIIFFSLFFYGYWDPKFLILIFYLLFFSYILIKYEISIKYSVLIILLPLFYFKYSFFFSELANINNLKTYSYTGDLPLAISFISFTCLAAIIDVKNNNFNKH